MTWMEVFGCVGVAYGPPLAMFVFTIMSDPIRIIILIASAFFWLVALFLSSLLWFVLPLKTTLAFGIVSSVLFQEVFRFLIYKLLRKAEAGLKKVTIPNTNIEIACNKQVLAYVAGLGFGIMSGAFSLVNIIADLVGPGTVGLKGGYAMFSLTSAFMTMCFILLHTFWGVIFFSAIDSNNLIYVSWVVISHILVSGFSLFTQTILWLAVAPTLLILILNGYIAFILCGGTCKNCKNAFLCGQKTFVPCTSST
uniref:Gamma-secretase subunit Aph-1 n=1 Tax=Clastoptera arizonana TaxID=38151 RepID=A0A1B6CPL9_9HEMI